MATTVRENSIATEVQISCGSTPVTNVVQETISRSESDRVMRSKVMRSASRPVSQTRRKIKVRSCGSCHVALILVWSFIMSCSTGISLLSRYKDYIKTAKWNELKGMMGCITIITASLPVASLLAEVVISRYKLIRYSLRAMWFLSIVGSIFTSTAYYISLDGSTKWIIQYIVFVIPLPPLIGAFLASSIPFGIDQIITGSNDNISVLIQWMIWALVSGTSIPALLDIILFGCIWYERDQVRTVLSPLPVLLLSVGLILDFFFGHKLIQEPVTVNPVTLIFKVLKYAAKHKYPVRRSAFAYCDDQQPSRLDYGKSKYGGPFTTEQVEDVKTFWRLLLVLIVLSSFLLPLTALHDAATYYHLQHGCIRHVLEITIQPYCWVIYLIPLYELLVYPCLRHRGPRILQSVGIGAAALVFSSLYGLTAETIQHFTSNERIQCLLQETCYMAYILILPKTLIVGFATVVLIKSTVEFICAQAPYNMRGLLIGFYLTAMILLATAGSLLYEASKKLDGSRYGIWFYLITLVLGVVSSVLLVCVIRWYKGRERDDIANYQAMVEDIYYKYQQQEALQE